jgi:hypothetical protein
MAILNNSNDLYHALCTGERMSSRRIRIIGCQHEPGNLPKQTHQRVANLQRTKYCKVARKGELFDVHALMNMMKLLLCHSLAMNGSAKMRDPA